MNLAENIIIWQKKCGRHNLPWQVKDPYKVWISEIMLQQTQVKTVISYFERFILQWPSVQDLALAKEDEVLALWSGLGYYSRARNLHKAARYVMDECAGKFPSCAIDLIKLPGVGPSTAAAIASLVFEERAAILDGNVKRVLARYFGILESPAIREVEQKLWLLAKQVLPESQANMPVYTQGMMDLGATLCTRSKPKCENCPLNSNCLAYLNQQTHLIPKPKDKKVKPEEYKVLAVLLCEGKVFLQKRADQGIWGGLYSFIEYQSTLDLAVDWPDSSLCEWQDASEEMRHSFTHKHWILQAQLICLAKPIKVAQDGAWFSKDEALQLGLPAPVRTLLLSTQIQAYLRCSAT